MMMRRDETLQWGRWTKSTTAARRSTSPSQGKPTLNAHCKDWCWSSNTLATWCEELTHWKRPWCWERVKAWGEEGSRGWEGWMAPPTQWAWVWVNSGRQWRTEDSGVLQSMGSQRAGHDLAAEQHQQQGEELYARGLIRQKFRLQATDELWSVMMGFHHWALQHKWRWQTHIE